MDGHGEHGRHVGQPQLLAVVHHEINHEPHNLHVPPEKPPLQPPQNQLGDCRRHVVQPAGCAFHDNRRLPRHRGAHARYAEELLRKGVRRLRGVPVLDPVVSAMSVERWMIACP